MKCRLLLIIFTIITISAFGQETNRSLFINMGINFLSNKETHYTSNFRSGIGYDFSIGYERKTQQSINRISLLFSYTKTGTNNISFSHILQPELKYEHLRTISNKGLSIGGYIDMGSLLNLRGGQWTNENGINYTIWSSLGLSTQFQKEIKLGNKKMNWNTRFSIPITSYLIRPSYTFPYTNNYLQTDVFDFGQAGLGKKIITGGKLVFLDKFLRTQFQTGLTFLSKNQKWEFGTNYIFDYMQTKETKSLFQSKHQLNLTTKFTK